ncbi:MAG TPA: ATP-grasp domain-containing protein [Alphaproteobacteria bacterium]|nr:ATP-grasp domain-containing protein [Alphaproteobacteria bacterium]
MESGRNATVAIVAVTARALAEAARRSPGFAQARLVGLDWFADRDLLAAADVAEAVPTRRIGGFAERPLLRAVRRLVPERSLLVTGSGFESRLSLLARLAADYRLAGNAPAVLARVKDPAQFFEASVRLGIPHPEIAREVPPNTRGQWLLKRIGAAGGGHIRWARRAGVVPVRSYAQRRVGGRPVSIAFLSDGAHIEPVGFTEQWPSSAPGRPFRYGGAALPAALPRGLAERMTEWSLRLAREFSLVGLNSADFLVDGEQALLLEVNPRPGGTLDLLDRMRPGLFEAHVEACFGRLRLPLIAPGPARAACVLYADLGPAVIGIEGWPAWAADRPHVGSTIPAGGPICTLFGEGPDAASARACAQHRAVGIVERLGAAADLVPTRL